ncbi:coreceptor-mediated virion attachment to host cell [Mactra antiquata]
MPLFYRRKETALQLYMKLLNCNCQLSTTLTPIDPEVVEGGNVTFVCTMSGAVLYVNWRLDVNASVSYSPVVVEENGKCALGSTTSILSNTTKYSYHCNHTVYQLTVKNVQRSEHQRRWSCVHPDLLIVPISTIKVRVSSVSITTTQNTVGVLENTTVEFTCQTSAARPNASVSWYKVESGVTSQINQNIATNITDDDFSITISTLKLVPYIQQNSLQIFCNADNAVNTSPIESSRKTLNVLCSPRPRDGIQQNTSSEMNQTSAFTFYAVANPFPNFTWWKSLKGAWTQLQTHNRYSILSFDLQSFLIIHEIRLEDFTSYKLVAENSIGRIEQIYFLNQYENSPCDDNTSLSAVIGYSVGIASGCIVLTFLSVFLIWRFCLKRADSNNPAIQESGTTNTETTAAETGFHNSISVTNYEPLERGHRNAPSTYSALDTSPPDHVQDNTEYENMNLQ